MSARQFVAVAFRLFAAWVCIGAFQAFGLIEATQRINAAWKGSPWVALIFIGVGLAIAVTVWMLSAPISRGLTFGLTENVEPRLSSSEVVMVGCVLMGLWWLKESTLPLISLWLKSVTLSPDSGQSAFTWLGTTGKVMACMYVLQICVAMFFICRSRQIARWTLRLAHVGQDSPADT